MIAFAYGLSAFSGPIGSGVIHALKIVAVAVVAQAVWGIRSFAARSRPAQLGGSSATGGLADVSRQAGMTDSDPLQT